MTQISKLNFYKNLIRNYVDELVNMHEILNTLVQYNVLLSEKEMHSLTQKLIDIDILVGSLKHANKDLEKFNNIIEKKLEVEE